MLNRFRTAVNSAVGNLVNEIPPQVASSVEGGKYGYNRPPFLQLNADEVQVSADHISRPIIVPRDISRLPWSAGYAEVINAGKTKLNEDQARAEKLLIPARGHITPPPFMNGVDDESNGADKGADEFVTRGTIMDAAEYEKMMSAPLVMTYFGLFDGHAGPGAAIMAVNCLQQHIQMELSKMREILLAKHYKLNTKLTRGRHSPPSENHRGVPDKTGAISEDMLVIGALEQAFQNMDFQIEEERIAYEISGGCCALAAVFLLGKLYVANAGDSRAVLCRGKEIIPLSTDFSPERERQRIQFMGYLHPELLHNEFTSLEFPRRLFRQDIGKQMLFRDAVMTGWSYKTVTEEDIKFPLIYGHGKKARVLATIGVTRGFGDHDLRVHDSDIYIKPFLSPVPEVAIYDMSKYEHNEDDFLIMATDGLWDVTSNEMAAEIVRESLKQFAVTDKSRYTSAAQELVMHARGLLKKGWRMSDNRQASGDDISCFVIPLHHYSNNNTLAASAASTSAADASPAGATENNTTETLAGPTSMDTTEESVSELPTDVQSLDKLSSDDDTVDSATMATAAASSVEDNNSQDVSVDS